MVMHNVLEEIGDDLNLIDGFNGMEDPEITGNTSQLSEHNDLGFDYNDLYRTGLLRRKHLLDLFYN